MPENKLHGLLSPGITAHFTAPAADLPADSTALPVLGTLEVTELREPKEA